MDQYKTLDIERDGSLAELILDRPDSGNAMGATFFEEYGTALSELDADPAVRAILVRANGKAFSYGLDLKQAMTELGPALQGAMGHEREALRRHIEAWQDGMAKPLNIGTPVIAAIHGWCIGGGVDLISACDMRYASADARFSVREARIAIVADLGSLQRLPRLIGEANTRELALTARDIDAAQARRIGLVNDVFDDADAMLAHARETAREIAALSPLTVQGIKRVLRFQDGKSMDDGLRYVAAWNSAFLPSSDLAEAMAAFFEKRQPRYRDI